MSKLDRISILRDQDIKNSKRFHNRPVTCHSCTKLIESGTEVFKKRLWRHVNYYHVECAKKVRLL